MNGETDVGGNRVSPATPADDAAAAATAGPTGPVDLAAALREADASLQASEERFRFLSDSIPQQVWTARPDGALDYVNRQVTEYFARPAAEIIGQGWQQVVHPDDLPECGRRWAHSLATGEPYEVEFRLRRAADGQYRWHIGRAAALRHAVDGRIVKWFGTNTDVTELKDAEAALREGESRYRLISDATNDGAWYWDIARGRLLWNDRLLNMLGVSRGQWGGTFDDFLARVHPDDRPHIVAAMNAHLERREPYHLEVRLLDASGGYRHCVTRGHAEWDAAGRAVRMAGGVSDITGRKLTEQRLRESEESFRLLFDAVGVGKAEIDPRTLRFVRVNRKLCDLTGYAADELLHLGPTDLTHPDDRPADVEGYARLARGEAAGGEYEVEKRYVRKDGAVIWVYVTITAARGPDGAASRFIVAMQDVTDRKRAAQALRDEAAINEILYEVGSKVAGELDVQKVVQTVTDAGTRLTRAQFGAFFYNVLDEHGGSYTLYTLSGAPREAFSKFEMPRATELFGPTFRGEGIIRCDDVTQDPRFGKNDPFRGLPAGHLPVRSYLAVPVVSRSGEVLGGLFFGHADAGVFTARDARLVGGMAGQAAVALDNARLYSQATRAQEDLRRANEDLERRVAERTAALEQLNDQLRISNNALQDFSSVASHDLQEPLRKIQAFGGRLADRYAAGLGDEGGDYLRRMLNAAGRMQTLINDLLAFSRVTTRARPFEPVDLNRVAAEVLSDLETAVQQSGGEVTVGPLPTIEADPTQMRQLVQNLLGNALKFTRPGAAPTVRLWVEPAAGEDGAVTLFVQDNGIGFDEKYLDRIFNVFQRLHGRGVYEGTGIGLAVVRKIAERHGGTVTARSRPGEGATFAVTLPLRRTTPPGPEASGSAPSESGSSIG